MARANSSGVASIKRAEFRLDSSPALFLAMVGLLAQIDASNSTTTSTGTTDSGPAVRSAYDIRLSSSHDLASSTI